MTPGPAGVGRADGRACGRVMSPVRPSSRSWPRIRGRRCRKFASVATLSEMPTPTAMVPTALNTAVCRICSLRVAWARLIQAAAAWPAAAKPRATEREPRPPERCGDPDGDGHQQRPDAGKATVKRARPDTSTGPRNSSVRAGRALSSASSGRRQRKPAVVRRRSSTAAVATSNGEPRARRAGRTQFRTAPSPERTAARAQTAGRRALRSAHRRCHLPVEPRRRASFRDIRDNVRAPQVVAVALGTWIRSEARGCRLPPPARERGNPHFSHLAAGRPRQPSVALPSPHKGGVRSTKHDRQECRICVV